ncbi:MAG TPA: heavy-metal-associated domain-containing protein [Gemmatimonadaceae bacterium]|nr:heavy-metal-associated domain-containing protein [Gemmatimonadaceae bacterium]
MRWQRPRTRDIYVSSLEIIMQSLTIPITGMSCGGCVNNVRNAVTKIAGVTDAHVTVGAATVTYEPTLTNPEALRRAIAQAGYGVAAA